VEALAVDGGTLSYQWWISVTEDKTVSRPISSSTEKSLSVSGDRDTTYFFVVVTNTTASGSRAKVESNLAKVLTVKRVNAAVPVITANPKNVSVELGKETRLSVSASLSDGGKLSYLWLQNTDLNDTAGWKPIEGATEANYVPDVSKAGMRYYRAVVMNTNADVNGKQTASQTSSPATVAVANEGKVNAQFPILSGPNTVILEKYSDPTALSVRAESPDGGTLSYQWFKTPFESNIGGEAIEGATNATFDPGKKNSPIAVYYYVEVTNTNTKVSGEPKALTKSNAVQVLGGLLEGTAVTARERVIPQTNANTETAVITPTSRLTAEFTAGPNPADRASGTVNFFRSGSRVESASLSVYDASGNMVKKITIRDPAIGTNGNRTVGSWNLRDTKGRIVSNGTYVVRGAVNVSGGKTEKVSLLLGVR